MKMDYKLLGKRIRARRKELHLTQTEAAEKLGVSTAYIGHMERGTRSPSIETLIAIINGFNISPAYLLQDYVKTDNPEFIPLFFTKDELDTVEKLTNYVRENTTVYKP